jgi:hypothetical protein
MVTFPPVVTFGTAAIEGSNYAADKWPIDPQRTASLAGTSH